MPHDGNEPLVLTGTPRRLACRICRYGSKKRNWKTTTTSDLSLNEQWSVHVLSSDHQRRMGNRALSRQVDDLLAHLK